MLKNYLLKNLSTGQDIGLYSNYKKIAIEYELKNRLKYHFSQKKSAEPFFFEKDGVQYSVTRFFIS